jgi:hypothetical protein
VLVQLMASHRSNLFSLFFLPGGEGEDADVDVDADADVVVDVDCFGRDVFRSMLLLLELLRVLVQLMASHRSNLFSLFFLTGREGEDADADVDVDVDDDCFGRDVFRSMMLLLELLAVLVQLMASHRSNLFSLFFLTGGGGGGE